MGRFFAFVLGGLAIALYGPHLFLAQPAAPPESPPAATAPAQPSPTVDTRLNDYERWWIDKIGESWYRKVFHFGPGIFAGLALILLAVRGRDAGPSGG